MADLKILVPFDAAEALSVAEAAAMAGRSDDTVLLSTSTAPTSTPSTRSVRSP